VLGANIFVTPGYVVEISTFISRLWIPSIKPRPARYTEFINRINDLCPRALLSFYGAARIVGSKPLPDAPGVLTFHWTLAG
jgi:hypothetical protein